MGLKCNCPFGFSSGRAFKGKTIMETDSGTSRMQFEIELEWN